MTVLVIGYKGMLGNDVMSVLGKEHKCVGADLGDIDITDFDNAYGYILKEKPDLIVNCAAYTNVDGCEENVDIAYKANAIGPRNLAVISNKMDIPIVHISTDYIFDGEGSVPYLEDDKTNPLSVYGKSKLSGENFIKNLTNKFFVLRTQWLYGKNGKNFVKTMVSLAEKNDTLKVVDDQFGSPTYSVDLAQIIAKLIKTEAYGVYHTTNEGVVSWFQFTKDILEIAGITNVKVNPCTTEEFPRPARRPSFSPLENNNLKLSGFEPMRNYKEALKEYIKSEDFQ